MDDGFLSKLKIAAAWEASGRDGWKTFVRSTLSRHTGCRYQPHQKQERDELSR